MSKTEPALLHFAEERSQSRAQDLRELWVVVIKCAFKALGMSALWGTVVTGVRLLLGDHVSVLSAVLTYGVVWVIWFGLRLEGDIDRHDESLCSERRAETYAPPQPKPELPAPADSPFMVHPYGDKDPYMLHRDGRTTPLLPDGRQAGLALNPPTVGAILREIIERHDGQWSRDRLMSIRVDGKRVTRKLYEKLTYYLAEGGFLQERPTGGFEIPPDVATYEDVTRYLPSLARPEGGNPTRTDGRSDGGQEKGGNDETRPDGGGALTLAERRKAEWLECNCDARTYLGRRNHDR